MIQRVDEISNQIATIQKLKMVNCYQVFGEKGPLNAIMAYYGDQTINLSEADEHYDELVDRISKVYATESRRAQIVVDEATEKILGRAQVGPLKSFEQRLAFYREVETPIFLPKAFAHLDVLPIVKFVIQKLRGNEEDAIQFENAYADWFGKGTLLGVSHGSSVRMPYRITIMDDETYKTEVGNALMAGDLLTLEITFGREGITASFRETLRLLQGDLILRVTDEKATASIKIMEENEILLAEELEREPRENAAPTERTRRLAANVEQQWKAFELPWGNVIYRARDDRYEYQVHASGNEDVTVSHVLSARDLNAGEGKPIKFGNYAFCLYEKGIKAEVHLLDQAFPRATAFYVQYVGRYYEEIS